MTNYDRRQAVGSIFPLGITNPLKLFKPKKPKGLLSFWEIKIFGWFVHISYKRTQFRISCVSQLYITHDINTQNLDEVLPCQ